MGDRALRDLHRLAAACGVRPTYRDAAGHPRRVSAETLLSVLRSLGEEVRRPEDAARALRERQRREAEHPLEPVIVAWDGRLPGVAWRGRRKLRRGAIGCELELEDGARRRAEARAVTDRGGTLLRWPRELRLPYGTHRISIEAGSVRGEATVLSAPRRVFDDPEERELGVFLPLYALRSGDDWGTGDLTSLERMAVWAAGLGARIMGTLPLLATFLDEPFEPSPYSPASRLFWNELYLDPASAPEMAISQEARRLVGSAAFQREAARLRRADLVDYRGAMALKEKVLRALAEAAFAGRSARHDELDRFVCEDPHADAYASFRAVAARRRAAWPAWPARLRNGTVRAGDFDEQDRRYHLYVQWLLRRQLGGLAGRAAAAGSHLYLDLPIGVNGGGFDVWRFPEAFVRSASVGAPPDLLFSAGQNWGFPPPHPRGQRTSGYRYFSACIENHLRYAGVLRIDHVMGLHRLYWIPEGADARSGAYVHYPADELYAVLSIQSHRHKARIVGENLGTVPSEVNRTLKRRGVLGMHIEQFEMRPDPRRALTTPPRGVLASLNTHDLPTFAAHWSAKDVDRRAELGLIDAEVARRERDERAAMRRAVLAFLRREGLKADTPAAVLAAILRRLARGPEEIMLVALEDLWLEAEPQNIPGIAEGYPNWRRKARPTLEEMMRNGRLGETLRSLVSIRRLP